jgi:dihydroflavonol-4-reductase
MGSVHALVEPPGGLLDETAGFDPARAVGPYARTKAMASRLVQAAARAGDVDAVLVLPTGVVGPFDFRTSEMGQLLLDLEAGRVPFVPPGGHDFVDVRDVALGTLAAADRGRAGEAWLLGGEYLAMRQVAELVASQAGRRAPPVLPVAMVRAVAAFAPAWERSTGRRALLTPYALHALSAPFRVSHEKARRELGYAPRPVAASLRDALAWHHARTGPRRAVGPGRVQLGNARC